MEFFLNVYLEMYYNNDIMFLLIHYIVLHKIQRNPYVLHNNVNILQPYHLLEESIQSGELIRVLEGCQPKVRNVHLLYADKKQPLKVRKFIDFVSENLTN